ncbi:DUF1127 domain-containing protein [Belnapia sp. T6]|uniref:DUF1127 domain-containing protein n=2 Tax=Belnapia mucosa TaxID=2804532 RepID=A0ABS1VCN3_9PROT|nr:DUF1127 domain-containing protein [Belnapia mucosa]
MHVSRIPMPVAASLALTGTTPPAARSIWPAWLSKVLTQAAERRQLLMMEERDLRDIGLTPSEARILAQKPLWRP